MRRSCGFALRSSVTHDCDDDARTSGLRLAQPARSTCWTARVRTLLVVAGAIVAVWLAFVIVVAIAKPDGTSVRDALRLLPDIVRLVRRLLTDRAIPRRTRWVVWVLLVYLLSPIDVIPDFVPVLGYADDAIITSLVLRHVVRRAGIAKVEEHWPGTPEGLAALQRLLRLPSR
jgi:uncharacterized membrane protein YkvA (DUF1232 family)